MAGDVDAEPSSLFHGGWSKDGHTILSISCWLWCLASNPLLPFACLSLWECSCQHPLLLADERNGEGVGWHSQVLDNAFPALCIPRQGDPGKPLHKHIPKINRPGEVPCPKTPAGLLSQGCWRDRRTEVEQIGHTSGGLRREGAVSHGCACRTSMYTKINYKSVNPGVPPCSAQLTRGDCWCVLEMVKEETVMEAARILAASSTYRGLAEAVLRWQDWEALPGAGVAAGKGRDDRITLPSPSL